MFIDLTIGVEDQFKEIKKLGIKAIEVFCDALGRLTSEELNSPNRLEIISKEIANTQSDFISDVFRWQRNITAETFKEYSEYLDMLSRLLNVLKSK